MVEEAIVGVKRAVRALIRAVRCGMVLEGWSIMFVVVEWSGRLGDGTVDVEGVTDRTDCEWESRNGLRK